MPVLFEEISNDLGLSLVQIGTIWGMVSLPNLVMSFASGLVGDRYGTRLTLTVACLLSGVTGALRGLSGGFTSLAVYMFLFGLSGVPIAFSTHKAAGEWFSGRQLGLANGVLAMGMGIGITLGTMFSATVLSPLLGGWQNIMFAYGVVAAVIGFLWLQTRHSPSHIEAAQSTVKVPFRQALSHVLRLRSVWLLALSQMLFSGCRSGLNGYLPLYLRGSGWTEVGADGALAALSAASVVGVIPLAMLSDRIGIRKAIAYPAIMLTIVGVGLLSVFSGVLVWPIVIFTGVAQEGLAAVVITMVMETEGVGTKYAGTALGLSWTLSGLGGFFSPPLGNRLAVINPSFAFIFWSAMAAISLLAIHFAKETGWKKKPVQI
jgi:MFS family permease